MKTQYKFGDIILIKFPFSDQLNQKKRPALVISDSGDEDILVARITSHPPQSTIYDVELIDWQQEGLAFNSVVKLNKLASIEKSLIDKELGKLSPADYKIVKEKFISFINSSLG